MTELAERVRALAATPLARHFGRGVQLSLLLVACAIFLHFTHPHYPVQKWLVWRYLGYWAATLVWSSGCVALGLRLLELLGPTPMPSLERLTYAFAVGVLAFFLGVLVVGLAGLIGPWLFWALPLAFIAVGARAALRYLVHARRLRMALAKRPSKWSWVEVAALIYGVLGLAFIYFAIIHPENASYDARWYHLGIAEHYVAERAIRSFPEGWHLGAFPFLPSVVFTWAFLYPGGRLFDQVGLCAHLELALFLATLIGMVVLHRRLVPGSRGRIAWVSLLIFPGIFLYDSSLHLGSDHIAAFWAPAIFLLFLRTQRNAGWQIWLLFAAVCAGALLTKYSVTCLLAFPALGVGFQLMLRSYRALRGRDRWSSALSGPALLLVAGLVLTAPHWAKNWLWYGNPVYPYAFEVFSGRPWEAYNADTFVRFWTTHPWATRGPLLDRVRATLPVLFTFSFVPHNWPAFHGMVPVFGSLFTLLSGLLPVLRASRRIWALAAASYLGVYIWFNGMQFDRYLQVILPWLAVVSSAILALLWRQRSLLLRSGVGVLVALQVAWGLDVIAIPAHAMTGQSPLLKTLTLVGAGYRKEYEQRLRVFEPYASIGDSLAPGDRVVLHEHHVRLGLKVPVVSDAMPIQGGLDYGGLGGPSEVYDKLRAWNVTHAVWSPNANLGSVSYAAELVFYHFLERHTAAPRSFGHFRVAKLVPAPRLPRPSHVAFFGCQAGYRWGLYPLKSMHFADTQIADPRLYPPAERLEGSDFSASQVLGAADYLIRNPACRPNLPADDLKAFKQVASRASDQLFVRSALLK